MDNKEGIMGQNQKLQTNQSGMVAITVTMILMIVISLIVIGFSTTIRREQRQALDAQLSSQAFYAAESGVNLIANKLRDPNTASISKEQCGPTEGGLNLDYNIGDGVVITCLLVNQTVDYVELNNVDTKSHVKRISLANNEPIASIKFEWTSGTQNSNNCGPNTNLPVSTAWGCSQPLLRIDLVNLTNGLNTINANALKASQFTVFLHPQKDPGAPDSVSYGTAADDPNNLGSIQKVSCTASGTCTYSIKDLPPGSSNFAIRVMSLYRTSSVVKIEANNGLGISRPIIGSQAIIDSTARAQDVLKRVQARIDLGGDRRVVPDFAIFSNGVCKNFTTSGIQTYFTATGNNPCAL